MNELEEMIKTLKSKLRHEKNVVSQISNELKLLKNKQVWHKVADRDLPQEGGLYYCYCKYPAGSGTFYEIIHSYDFCSYDIVSWTELPKYEEK